MVMERVETQSDGWDQLERWIEQRGGAAVIMREQDQWKYELDQGAFRVWPVGHRPSSFVVTARAVVEVIEAQEPDDPWAGLVYETYRFTCTTIEGLAELVGHMATVEVVDGERTVRVVRPVEPPKVRRSRR